MINEKYTVYCDKCNKIISHLGDDLNTFYQICLNTITHKKEEGLAYGYTPRKTFDLCSDCLTIIEKNIEKELKSKNQEEQEEEVEIEVKSNPFSTNKSIYIKTYMDDQGLDYISNELEKRIRYNGKISVEKLFDVFQSIEPYPVSDTYIYGPIQIMFDYDVMSMITKVRIDYNKMTKKIIKNNMR